MLKELEASHSFLHYGPRINHDFCPKQIAESTHE